MASVSVLLFVVLSTLLAGTRGFLIGYDELAGFVNVSNTVHAMTISDYYTQINDGAIVAYTLNLTGSLSAATVDFGFLHVGDTTTGDLTALNTHTPSATFQTLQNSGNSTFHSPVTVEGELNVRGSSEFADLDALSLTASNETNINGILFAQSNLQVTENLSVRGNTRIFGDLLANSSVDVGMNLDVHDEAHVGLDLMISNDLHTMNLTVDGTAVLAQIKVAGWVNATESADVGGDVHANSGAFKGSLSAHDATIMENFNGKGTLNVNGYLKSVKTASFGGNLAVQGNQVVQSWLSVDSTADFQQDLSVSEDLTVDMDISSDGTLSAVDAMFTTLSVDTATLETLTAEFVTSTNLQATDATIGKSFMSGVTTLDTLVVKSTSTLTSAVADSVTGNSVNAGSATTTDLEVSDSGLFVNVEVKTMISAGSPSSMTHFANFDTANTDMLKFLELDGEEGDITTLEGNEFNYMNINASMFTSATLMSETGDFDEAVITNANIDRLKSVQANITTYEVDETRVVTFFADGNSTITDVTAQDTETDVVTAQQALIDALTAFQITSQNLTATTATISTLMSDKAWINRLTATNSTITNVWATTATAQGINGDSINYTISAAVTNITTPRGVSRTFDSSRTIAASWLWSQNTNFSTLDSKTLRVTGQTWLHNLTLQDDLMVDGESTLQMGFISGPTVVAELDVVESTLLDSLSATGTSFLTDLMVKRVTISDDFQANEAQLGAFSTSTLSVTGPTTVMGGLTVNGDSLLRGNLVVAGTTQFQTGSFSRIGTALITTTDMEAFNLNAADGIFGEIETSDFEARQEVMFERSISLAALRDDPSGAEFSLFMQIAPTTFQAVTTSSTFNVNTMAYLHTGNASVDALVVTSSTNASLAALRFKGDGSVDLIDGDILFEELSVGGGVEFENENNIAYPDNHPTVVLSQGQESTFFAYSDLEDRDLVAPGDLYDPTRFQQPTLATDLLTLAPGHYRVSGQVYLAPSAAATTSLVAIVQASVSAWMGTSSNSSTQAFWTTSCIANFNLVSSATWGGSCSFSDVLVVGSGETVTLRTSVSWPFSSSPTADTLTVSPKSNIEIAEYFERASEGL